MAIEDDILAAVTAIKAKTDNLEFYPFYRVSGTLTPNVTGDYFFYRIGEFGNIYKNYVGDIIETLFVGFALYRGSQAIWTGATLTGSYTASTGATGTATVTELQAVVTNPDLVTLPDIRSLQPQAVINTRQ